MSPRDPGELRDRISIQNRAAGTDSYGQRNGDWQTVRALCWASVEELSGRELVSAREIVADVSLRVILRGFPNWRSRLGPSSRLTFGVRVFEVLAVINRDGRDDWLEIFVSEIVPEGS